MDQFLPESEGFGEFFFAKNGIDAIHVISKSNEWYQYGEMKDIINIILKYKSSYRNVFAYGISMGAYAAIRYGNVLDAIVIAMSPQYSINPSVMPGETRWLREAHRIFFTEEESVIKNPHKTIVFYDPLQYSDARHVDRIAKDIDICRVPIPYSGHFVAAYLSDIGIISKTLLDIINFKFNINEFMEEIHSIEKPARYYSEISHSIMKVDPYTALSFAQKALEMTRDDSSYLYHLSTLYRRIGDLRNAEYFIKKAIECSGSGLHYKRYLSLILIDEGRFDECRELVKTMIGINGQEGEYYYLMALCHAYEGNISAAIENGKKSVSLNPKYKRYKNTLDKLIRASGNRFFFFKYMAVVKLKRSRFIRSVMNGFFHINKYTRIYKLFCHARGQSFPKLPSITRTMHSNRPAA
ncbi:hypothetical protein CFR80_12620 [Komagataeibacter oboediens]|uniref:Uncharacterized protein n=2 Tax=Komagataeibacter oboediens TaxID=65958 RepID=A0A318QQG4_9PROT|nr:hypothetical protein CFR80_12620 [Komagataeibacter oboediens]